MKRWMLVLVPMAIGLTWPGCGRNPEVRILAQGVDDQDVFVVVDRHALVRPVQFRSAPGRVEIFVWKNEPGLATARCETNSTERTVRVAVAHGRSRGGTIEVYVDGRSLGDWRIR